MAGSRVIRQRAAWVGPYVRHAHAIIGRKEVLPPEIRLFDGFGGMMSFELRGGVEAAEAFMGNLTIPISAPSLGGVESLITRPVKTSHSGMPRAERERAGISEGLIRLSVGLEAPADLRADFERALESC